MGGAGPIAAVRMYVYWSTRELPATDAYRAVYTVHSHNGPCTTCMWKCIALGTTINAAIDVVQHHLARVRTRTGYSNSEYNSYRLGTHSRPTVQRVAHYTVVTDWYRADTTK